MKCEIIRDLFPSYCDGITSDESNTEIEKHIAECSECMEILGKMEEKNDKSVVLKKEIEPLKKVKKRNVFKIVISCIVTAFVGVFMFFLCFWGIIPTSSDNVDVQIECQDVTLHQVEFDSLDENNEPTGNVKETDIPQVQVTVNLKSRKGAIRISDKTKYNFLSDGKKIYVLPEFSVYSAFDVSWGHGNEYSYSINNPDECSKLVIHYLDRDVTYDLYEYYQDYINN